MKSKLKLALKALALIFLLANGYALAKNQMKYVEKIEYLVAGAHKYIGFNGTVLVANNDEIVFQKSYGFADKENKIILTPKHRLSPGSISKEFTTVAMMTLEEKGKLSFDDKLSKYLPNLPKWSAKISIKNILTHTSGLPKIEWHPNIATVDVLKQLYSIDTLKFKPSSQYLYGNLNVVIRALIIEKITGKPFEAFLQEKILTPAGMINAF